MVNIVGAALGIYPLLPAKIQRNLSKHKLTLLSLLQTLMVEKELLLFVVVLGKIWQEQLLQ